MNMAIRDLSDDAHAKLKALAKQEGRSVNKQAVYMLERAIGRKNIVVGKVKK